MERVDYTRLEKALHNLHLQQENLLDVDPTLSDLMIEAVRESVIQRFEICWDCLWKTLKRFLIVELGLERVPNSPNPVMSLAVDNNLLAGSVKDWHMFGKLRTATAHDYSKEKADEALACIESFIPLAQQTLDSMQNFTSMHPISEEVTNLAVDEKSLDIIQSIISRFLPDTHVWFFGSRVLGRSHSTSDLDMVIFLPEKEPQLLWHIREQLEEADLPFDIDIHSWNNLPKEFQDRIKETHIEYHIPRTGT